MLFFNHETSTSQIRSEKNGTTQHSQGETHRRRK
jgi:hypothetical protein